MAKCRVCERELPPPRKHGGPPTVCPSTYVPREDQAPLRIYSQCERATVLVGNARKLVEIEEAAALAWAAREINAVRMQMARKADRLRRASPAERDT